MKSFKKVLVIFITAIAAIFLWESTMQLTSPVRRHARLLSFCAEIFDAQQDELNAALVSLTVLAGTTDEPQSVADGLYAYVEGDSPDMCLVSIPLKNYGDFYQNTYTYGLLWSADCNPILEKNPGIILVSLGSGWCAYASVRPQ